MEMNVKGEGGLSTFPNEFRYVALRKGSGSVYAKTSPMMNTTE